MFQRPQNIFLILIIVMLLVSFFLPVWTKQNRQTQQKATLTYSALQYQAPPKTAEGNTSAKSNAKQATRFSFLSVLAGITIVVAAYSVWVGMQASILAKAADRFRKRLLQMKLGLFISVLLSGMLGLTVYYTAQGESMLLEEAKVSNNFAKFQIGFYLMIVALLCNLMANRFIRREQQLVASSDRLR